MNKTFLSTAVLWLSLLASCGGTKSGQQEEIVGPKAAVKTGSLARGGIESHLVLNGKTVFMKKNQVVAPISGYITEVRVKFGDMVQEGEVLFEIETRENKALKQSGKMDTGLGEISVAATTSGVVNEPVTLGKGSYVVEGATLCSLVDNNDLLVLVHAPYENHSLMKPGTKCMITLPDNSTIGGTVSQASPFVDETSQTQEVYIKPAGSNPLPENMNLTATFLKSGSSEALLLPKKAILANETQDEFWVMKLVQDSIAVIVPIETGIKNDSMIEVISPELSLDDIIIMEGGYGLEDSSLVTIVE